MKKYLVYKVSGGLCHMLYQINRAIHLSKLSDRFLIIDCQGNAFDNDFNKYFNIPFLVMQLLHILFLHQSQDLVK